MDDPTFPPPFPPKFPTLIRACEANRFQDQVLAQIYGRVCPEIRRPLAKAEPSYEHQNPIQAAKAAGA